MLRRREAFGCHGCEQKLGEVRLEDNKIRISRAWRANVTGMAAQEPGAEGLALPKSVKAAISASKSGERVDVNLDILYDDH